MNGQTVTLGVNGSVGTITKNTGTSSGKWTWSHAAITTPTQNMSVTLAASDGVTTPATTRTIVLTVRPPAPTEVSTATNGAYGLDVTWDAVAGTGVTYNVYVSTTSGFTPGAATLVASGLTGTHHTVIGLSPGTTYYTAVTANAGAVASFATSADAPTTTAVAQESEANGVVVYSMLNPNEDDPSGVTSNWSPYSEEELRDGEPLENETITLTLSGLPKHQVLLLYPGTRGIPFPPGDSSISITVDGQTGENGWYEHTGSTATIVLTAHGYGSGYTWVCEALSVIAYRPTVNVSVVQDGSESPDPEEPNPTDEGPKPVKFRVHRAGYQDFWPEFDVLLAPPTGTTEAADYINFPTSVTIPKNALYKDFTVEVKDDDHVEADETLIAEPKDHAGATYLVAKPDAKGKAKVVDNDVFVVLISGHTQNGGNDNDKPGGDQTGAEHAAVDSGIVELGGKLEEAGFKDQARFSEDPGNADDYTWTVLKNGPLDNSKCGTNVGFIVGEIKKKIAAVKADDENAVLKLAMIGYSHGGGTLYLVSKELAEDRTLPPYQLGFTAYIDAVEPPLMKEEVRQPLGTAYHVSYCQSETDEVIVEPEGAPTQGNAVFCNPDLDHQDFEDEQTNERKDSEVPHMGADGIDRHDGAHSAIVWHIGDAYGRRYEEGVLCPYTRDAGEGADYKNHHRDHQPPPQQ